jgi:hypothetical protein
MRSLIIAAVAAFAFAGAATADSSEISSFGHKTHTTKIAPVLLATGHCREAHGRFARCPTPIAHKPCRDKHGKFTKCPR